MQLFKHYRSNVLIQKYKKINNIQLINVAYKYNNKTSYALKNINLMFNNSTLNAIVGPSGSGKSTLIDIISGYREKSSGVIMINDECTNPLSLNISFVPQEPQILDGTIGSHIKYGRNNIDNKMLIKASKLSGAYEFINNLPEKFETKVTENASCLSRGQKQRLDLARAIAQDSQVLVLDEPTSNLDILSESTFMETIGTIRTETNKIIIIIAHRLNTIKNADQIIVIEGGKVTGVGDHLKLLEENNWYKNSIGEIDKKQ